MINLPDQNLVVEVLNGNDEAFAILVERYQKPIFNMAYRMCGDYDEAADLAQEAFLQIYRSLSKYDPEKKFFSWMYRVSHNICVNVLNKKPKHTTALDDVQENRLFSDDALTRPEAHFENSELKAAIDNAILNLPSLYHDVIYLRYVHNLSYQGIADALALPLSTIETRIYRGKALLQQSLREYRPNSDKGKFSDKQINKKSKTISFEDLSQAKKNKKTTKSTKASTENKSQASDIAADDKQAQQLILDKVAVKQENTQNTAEGGAIK